MAYSGFVTLLHKQRASSETSITRFQMLVLGYVGFYNLSMRRIDLEMKCKKCLNCGGFQSLLPRVHHLSLICFSLLFWQFGILSLPLLEYFGFTTSGYPSLLLLILNGIQIGTFRDPNGYRLEYPTKSACIPLAIPSGSR